MMMIVVLNVSERFVTKIMIYNLYWIVNVY